MDYRFGMGAIESMSRDFRNTSGDDRFNETLEKATKIPFKEFLKNSPWRASQGFRIEG